MALASSTKTSTLAERVADDLRQAIRRGELRGGMPLRQNEVADALGVSSTPVREAFAILQREGLVQRNVHRGVVVFEPTITDLLAAYEIRGALEPLAARYATRHIADGDLAELRSLIGQMERATDDA